MAHSARRILLYSQRTYIHDLPAFPVSWTTTLMVYFLGVTSMHYAALTVALLAVSNQYFRFVFSSSSGNQTLRYIPTERDFQTLQDAYYQSLGPSVIIEKRGDGSSGFLVPVEIQYSPLGGRGLFTKANITKGQIVSNIRTGAFEDHAHCRRFLRKVPDHLVKETVEWLYLSGHQGDSEAYVYIDLDEGNMLNHGDSPEWSEGRPPYRNLAQVGNQNIALRDIHEGEELLLDYHYFLILKDGNAFTRPPWYDNLREEYGLEDVSDFLVERNRAILEKYSDEM